MLQKNCSLRLMGKVLCCPQPCCSFGDGTWVPPALLPQEHFTSSTKQGRREGRSSQPHLPLSPGYKAGLDLYKLRTRLLLPPGGMCHRGCWGGHHPQSDMGSPWSCPASQDCTSGTQRLSPSIVGRAPACDSPVHHIPYFDPTSALYNK